MARTETLTNLIAQVRERAEVRAVYVSDANLTVMINQSIAELYNIILEVAPEYYLSSTNISVVAGTDTYALHATFYKLQGLDYVDGTGLIPLRRFNFAERGMKLGPDGFAQAPAAHTRYRVMGSNVILVPVPTWSGTLKCWYAPAPAKLDDGGDTFDGVAGWEEYVVLSAAIKALTKEESDIGPFVEQLRVVEARIRESGDRDNSEPDRVRDVYAERAGLMWPSGRY